MLTFGNSRICGICRNEIMYAGDVTCRRCGRPLYDATAEFCNDCKKYEHIFDRGVSLLVYNDISRGAIFRFKYRNRQEYSDFFASETAKKLGREIKAFNADAIIAVPLHKDKLRQRGFNQSELLAKKIAELLNINFISDYMLRIRKTAPQKNLNRDERRKNLKKSFKIRQNDVKLKKIIVIDDIYTTGSTIDEIAYVLKKAGVSKVYFVTIATGSAM